MPFYLPSALELQAVVAASSYAHGASAFRQEVVVSIIDVLVDGFCLCRVGNDDDELVDEPLKHVAYDIGAHHCRTVGFCLGERAIIVDVSFIALSLHILVSRLTGVVFELYQTDVIHLRGVALFADHVSLSSV